ncbi:cyclopropane fatty-acyl-phospholipid synthase-like methyltransferase [Paraburkholderia sp. GAS33]|uniref:class I SAM-dependent methyltransferase n=1 Tax=Paraburkholderia sp. GAS33 TaxID=3035130 RepID=UPI003D252AB0
MGLAKYTGCDQKYYQKLHDEHPAFQNNNWMLTEIEALRLYGASTLIEIGCGNGKFLSAAANSFRLLTGIDWARAPAIDEVIRCNKNVTFIQSDLIAGFPPVEPADLLVSADFLEHLPTDSLLNCLRRYHDKASFHFHKIACYDDGHSHLSILEPVDWLEIFKSISNDYIVFSLEKRLGDRSKQVCCITNHNPYDGKNAIGRLNAIESSNSWKITAPYRKIVGKFRR